MTAYLKIKEAVAASFAEAHLETAPSPSSRIVSRDLIERCIIWCRSNHLPHPSPQQLAKAIREVGGVAGKSNGQRVWRGLQWCDTHSTDFVAIANRDTLRRLSNVEPLLPHDVFCETVGIGRTTLYEMRQRGEGPNMLKQGHRCYVRAFDALEWCRRTGRHAAILRISDWLHTNVERPCARASKALRVGSARDASANIHNLDHLQTRTADEQATWV